MRPFFIQSFLSLLFLMLIGCTPIDATNELGTEELREILLRCKKNVIS